MPSEWFSFTTDAGQLLSPLTVCGNEDGIIGEELWLLVPAYPATVHVTVGFVKLSSNSPHTNVSLRDNMSLPALFSHSTP